MSDWVLATRAAELNGDLAAALASHGLTLVAFPTLREVEVEDPAGWAAVAEGITGLAWIAFTSARAPRALRDQARHRGLDANLATTRVAAVGPATAAAAAAAGYAVDLVGVGGASEVAGRLRSLCQEDDAVLHACGRDHRPELAAALAAAGLRTLPLVVYATEIVAPELLPALPPGTPAAVLLSSPRATEGYLAACGRRYVGAPHLAFGRVTAAAAQRLGLDARALREPTVACILEELCPT
jgi:uroporphyrinogen-III synthase